VLAIPITAPRRLHKTFIDRRQHTWQSKFPSRPYSGLDEMTSNMQYCAHSRAYAKKIFEMKKPMVKRVPTEGIHVTTIRLDDATLAALDEHAKAQAGGPRARSWLIQKIIQKIITEWLNRPNR
jgi:hypothetical protein